MMFRRTSVRSALRLAVLACLPLGVLGCTQETASQKPVKRFEELAPASNLPDFMEGTLYDRTELINTGTYNVSSYGLVGHLRGTGDCTASNVVRQYMIKEIARRGFGDALIPGFEKVSPGDVLRDPNYAIVRVDAFIPPGARRDDFIDAQITCLPGNQTSSLGNGVLFETDLKEGGADVDNPAGQVNAFVRVKGPIVVNPAYVLENPGKASPQARASLRQGRIMFNARVLRDRPLMLQLRNPQWSMSRAIEKLIQQRFQSNEVAKAQNEGIVDVYVPHSYRGNWQHFAEVVRHMYTRSDAAFNASKSRQLAEVAVQPGAPLEDISYCFEAIGFHALPAARPLLNHPDQAVAYYAARAVAFIGDDTGAAEQRLMQMARVTGHPFQMTAIRTLGHLPRSHSVNSMLRELLVNPQAQVRIEAYTILARNNDSSIISTPVAPHLAPHNQKFLLDRVPCDAPPMIYVTRTGKPRIALMGRIPDLNLSVPFTTMDNRLTLAGRDRGRMTLFFRDPLREKPVSVDSQPDLDIIISRLGGMGVEETTLNFSYGEVSAILQELSNKGVLTARSATGEVVRTAFVMQTPPRVQDDIGAAGLIAAGVMPGNAPEFGPPATVGGTGSQGATSGSGNPTPATNPPQPANNTASVKPAIEPIKPTPAPAQQPSGPTNAPKF